MSRTFSVDREAALAACMIALASPRSCLSQWINGWSVTTSATFVDRCCTR